MFSDVFGSSFLLALPDDIFTIVTRSLSAKDVCNLGLCSRGLNTLVASDKVWLAQCDKLEFVPYRDLIEWRKGVCSYKALYSFLVNVQSLLGIWVHQNPELGNVVYVMPGFLSVVGCRIIPQEVGPLGLEDGPILWAPVFEILCNYEGSTAFFLHGRDRGNDYVYPGLLKSVNRTCNVLLLEAEPWNQSNGSKLVHSKSFDHQVDKEQLNKISRSESGIFKSRTIVGQSGKVATVPFSRLGFGDRRRLLDVVTSQVRVKVPDTTNVLLFPLLRTDEVGLQRDIVVLYERRLLLLQMYRCGDGLRDPEAGSKMLLEPTQLGSIEIRKSLDCISNFHSSNMGDEIRAHFTKKKTLSGLLKNGFKQILGKSSPTNSNHEFKKKTFSSCESKHALVDEFLQSGDTMGLSLRATTMKLSSYRAWPNMHDSRFALYKLPIQSPRAGQEHAGLWGGTFGWPPGTPSEDKPGKALFLVLISYEESEGQQLLIATKILEGTSYVLHPNGSAMFIANIGQPSADTFPWDTDEDSNPIYVKQSFIGEGIANGYGFRYPGSKPGSLFVIQDGLLAFMWKDSGAVLTLQRLNLPELLKKGERMPALSPVSNFAYLTKTYSNVFSGFSNSSNSMSSPRILHAGITQV
ncbi:F-box protein [Abeliophyllum distichum]|uniref:F-box protein n=1 Tax=Abeliophyllum distichum TaxID=126358 RepID=A0ABD1V6A4_9LAMI